MRHATHVYGWDNEPVDERPSEFAPTTGYSALSGFYTPHELNERVARRQRGVGLGTILVVAASLLGLAAWGLHALARVLHG